MGIDTRTPMGKAMARMAVVFAKLERDFIRMRYPRGAAGQEGERRKARQTNITTRPTTTVPTSDSQRRKSALSPPCVLDDNSGLAALAEVRSPAIVSMGNSWGHKTSFAHPSCNDGTGSKMHLCSAHRAIERGPSIPAFIPLATVRSHSVAPSPIR
jgi:hypothetical protein